LEGEFVYGWDGKDLLLLPVDSPDYKQLVELNNLRYEKKKFDSKNMIVGATYKTNQNNELIYLGRFYERNGDNKESKSYFFYDRNSKYNYYKVTTIKSLTGNIIDIVDENCIEDYSNLMDELLKSSYYSTREQKYDEYMNYTLIEFKESLNKHAYSYHRYYVQVEDKYVKYHIERYRGYSYYNSDYKYNVYALSKGHKDEVIIRDASIEQVFNKIKPKYLVTYDKNKNIIKEWK